MQRTQFASRLLDRRVVLIAVSLLSALWLQAPRLLDEFQCDEDFRSFYEMNRYQDASLYPRVGPLTTVRLPWGDVPVQYPRPAYGLLFYAASAFASPILFSKLIGLVLVLVCVWHLYGFGLAVRGRSTGTILALGYTFLNLASPTSLSVLSGLPRSFASPLIIVLVHYLYRRKRFGAVIAVAMCAAFYVPSFLLAMATWGLYALRLKHRPRLKLSVSWRDIVALLLAVTLGCAVLQPFLWPRLRSFAASRSPVVTREQSVESAPAEDENLWDRSWYSAGGRLPLFELFPVIGHGGLFNKTGDAIHLALLSCAGCVICALLGRRGVVMPRALWCVLWASVVMFVLAWVSIWQTNSLFFHLPSRYTRVGLFLFASSFVLLNIQEGVRQVVRVTLRKPGVLAWFVGGLVVLFLWIVFLIPAERVTVQGLNLRWLLALVGLVFGVLGMVAVRRSSSSAPGLSRLRIGRASRLLLILAAVIGWTAWAFYARIVRHIDVIDPSQAERDLLAYAAGLPTDALIAGTPRALDNIQLFSRRQVLFSREGFIQDAEIVRDALSAYYAEDIETVSRFCRDYEIDYLVVDLGTYSEAYLAKGQIIWEPYNGELLASIAGREVFALTEVPDEIKDFQSGDLYVVACEDLSGQ